MTDTHSFKNGYKSQSPINIYPQKESFSNNLCKFELAPYISACMYSATPFELMDFKMTINNTIH